jgi:hypothetical protein
MKITIFYRTLQYKNIDIPVSKSLTIQYFCKKNKHPNNNNHINKKSSKKFIPVSILSSLFAALIFTQLCWKDISIQSLIVFLALNGLTSNDYYIFIHSNDGVWRYLI